VPARWRGHHPGLADLLDRDPKPLNPRTASRNRRYWPSSTSPACIGCTLCIQACPVDAIVGAPKQMHTVIEALCTGCELCLPPCPVDCIEPGETIENWRWPKP
jgi:Na+-translocating ferredoxin:NAD+ oxidoreductase subunit B